MVAALSVGGGRGDLRARCRRTRPRSRTPRRRRAGRLFPLLAIGVLGALAFASENAHQSWSAVFAQDELEATATLTSVAPAVFAATVAVTRFAIGGLPPRHAQYDPARRRGRRRGRRADHRRRADACSSPRSA